MSVFRLQEWWQTQLSQSEEFDQGCMAIGNIDNAEPAADKIVSIDCIVVSWRLCRFCCAEE